MAEHLDPPVLRRYPPELKERAVRLVRQTAAEQIRRHGAVGLGARQLGIGPESLRHWVRSRPAPGHSRPARRTPTDPDRRVCGQVHAARGAQYHNSSRGVRTSSVTPAPLWVSK